MSARKLRMGMVGGGRDAFIGAVHRRAAALDGQVEFVAGALSSTPEKALASARDLGLSERRSYPDWEAMLRGELALPASERIDFVSIVTPNHMHYPVARAFAAAGINVICDKPLVHTAEQASDLVRLTRDSGVVFAVTYNYTGYPLVKEARQLIADGRLGKIQKVIVEYNQGWLVTRQEAQGNKQADWRTDPARSGVAGAIGDIGSHAENLVSSVTGLRITELCADLSAFAPGRRLDDDGNLLLRFDNGARGLLFCSQISTGEENNLRLRVYGTLGALCWHQEEPNVLAFTPLNEPTRLLKRGNPLPERGRATLHAHAIRPPGGLPGSLRQHLPRSHRRDARPGGGGAARRGPVLRPRLPQRSGRRAWGAVHRDDGRQRPQRRQVDARDPRELKPGSLKPGP